MAEDAGRGMRSGGNLFEVSPTDAAGVHADEQFSTTNLRYRNSLQADVVRSAVDCGQHGRGNRFAAVFDCDLSGYPHRLLDELNSVCASLSSIISYFAGGSACLGSVLRNSTVTVIESRYGESSGVKWYAFTCRTT